MELGQSRRKAKNIGVIHADVGERVAEWLRKQKELEGRTWKGYFKNLMETLTQLSEDRQTMRREVEDLQKDNQQLREEIYNLKNA